MMEPLNVAFLVTDSPRLGFERPWNRNHFALADVRNPNCSGQEQEMDKTGRLDKRRTRFAMGNSDSAKWSGSAYSGFSTPNRGIRPNGSNARNVIIADTSLRTLLGHPSASISGTI
jgi:hypothetical protein